MKILYLASRFPAPPIGGDKLRVYRTLEYLSRRHTVSLYSLSEQNLDAAAARRRLPFIADVRLVSLPRWRSYLQCVWGLWRHLPLQVYYYYSRALHELVAEQAGQFDLIFCHLVRMAEYGRRVPGVPRILDLTDAFSLNYERCRQYQRGPVGMRTAIERSRVLRYETAVLNDFDCSLLISPRDRDHLAGYADTRRVRILTHGVDEQYFTFARTPYFPHQVVFVGNMRTFPNTDAVAYFARAIMPPLEAALPRVKFTVVGAHPRRGVRALGEHSNIEITGQVDDVRPYVRQSAVSVCPVRVGAGVQNKILESMALGTPVVTTSVGLEGIEAEPERDLLVADTPEEFCRQILRLVHDPALRTTMINNARGLIERKYAAEVVLHVLDEILEDLVPHAESVV